MKISDVKASRILDSRGEETIEVNVNGEMASAPEGKSVGEYESKPYHNSLDWNINFLNSFEINFPINKFEDLEKVEELIKKEIGLKDIKEFGANALFALESAILKALAVSKKKELWQIINSRARKFPRPAGNAVGGGLHSKKFEQHPIFQEFLLMPNEESFEENVKAMNQTYETIGKILNTNEKNDEGAWQTELGEVEVLDILDKLRGNLDLGLDIAASSFYKEGTYKYKVNFDRKRQIEFVNLLIEKYNLLYVEDPLEQEDFDGFAKISKKALVVGDDLTVTHADRLRKAIEMKSINAMIIKPNQNGSLTEVKKIFEMCKKNKIKTILSHRSGETMDDALADYAFGFGADFIKCGISGEVREVKLKRMIEIEQSISMKGEKKV